MPEHQRDLQWDALRTTSERLSVKYGREVKAKEHRGLLRVTGGFQANGHLLSRL